MWDRPFIAPVLMTEEEHRQERMSTFKKSSEETSMDSDESL